MPITLDGTGSISGLTATGISAVQNLPATGTITNLTTTTISDGTNSTSATNCIQGSAKAWVNFNGTGTVAIRASYNVSSITDNGTGDYTVNFTNAFADANYTVAGTVKYIENDGASTVFGMSISNRASNPTASAARIVTGQANNSTQFDMLIVTVVIHR